MSFSDKAAIAIVSVVFFAIVAAVIVAMTTMFSHAFGLGAAVLIMAAIIAFSWALAHITKPSRQPIPSPAPPGIYYPEKANSDPKGQSQC
jgi:hypothetical protein